MPCTLGAPVSADRPARRRRCRSRGNRVEHGLDARAVADHVELVGAREVVALPHDLHGRDRAALSSSVSARTSSISLSAGRSAPAEGHVGAGRRDAHRRPRDRLHEIDAMARALEHLAAAGGLVGEPCAAGRGAEIPPPAIRGPPGEQIAHPRDPVDGAPLVADRADDSRALDAGRSPARRRDRAPPASPGTPAAPLDRATVTPRCSRGGVSTSTASGSPRSSSDAESGNAWPRSARRPGAPRRLGSPHAGDLLPEHAQALQMRLRDPSHSRSGRSSCDHLTVLEHGARSAAHPGFVPHARVEPLAERHRRQFPGRLGIPHHEVGPHARLNCPACRTAAASRARSAGARRAAPRSASGACAPPRPARPRRVRRTVPSGRDPRCP